MASAGTSRALVLFSGGQDSVGLRCPSHPVAQALLRAFERIKGGQGGVAAPSANRFGQVSPTAAQHVRDEFAGLPGVTVHVLDGGEAAVGIESTIVDLSRGFPALLRPGHITPEQIADPSYAARTFFTGAAHTNGLLDIPGWEDLGFGAAAQEVQVSAFPGRYDLWQPQAAAWLAALG